MMLCPVFQLLKLQEAGTPISNPWGPCKVQQEELVILERSHFQQGRHKVRDPTPDVADKGGSRLVFLKIVRRDNVIHILIHKR